MGELQKTNYQRSGKHRRKNERTGNLKKLHQPVLLKEVLQYLNPQANQNFIDCTVGFAGHALAILERVAPRGKVLGIELDEKVLEVLKNNLQATYSSSQAEGRVEKSGVLDASPKTTYSNNNLKERLILVQGNYADLKKIVKQNNFPLVNGILFDLGMSLWQIEKSNRGFSFLRDERLDMRYAHSDLTAQEIVNKWPEKEIIRIFKDYGQERYARLIAKLINQRRRIHSIKTTSQLVEIIKEAVPVKYQYGRIHFATRVFQALRIATNDELNNFKKSLPQTKDLLEQNGKLAIISFHSLEDRIVKNFFRQESKKGNFKILTKKPIRPTNEEVNLNPRSRSAKLRISQKI